MSLKGFWNKADYQRGYSSVWSIFKCSDGIVFLKCIFRCASFSWSHFVSKRVSILTHLKQSAAVQISASSQNFGQISQFLQKVSLKSVEQRVSFAIFDHKLVELVFFRNGICRKCILQAVWSISKCSDRILPSPLPCNF